MDKQRLLRQAIVAKSPYMKHVDKRPRCEICYAVITAADIEEYTLESNSNRQEIPSCCTSCAENAC
jgi:methyl coenzyme M reductase subunit C